VPTPPDRQPDRPDRLIGYLLRHAQHAWQLALDDALRPLGISGAGFGVLRMIQQQPGSSGAALAAESIYSPQATQQILVTLEAAGLVERRADPHDGRRRLAYLSGRGSDVLTEAYRRASGLEERMTAGLSEAEFHQFRAWLQQAARAVTPPP
jgi:DNA-binding MarR family transcriptional regulator